jgi:hypothetical protein
VGCIISQLTYASIPALSDTPQANVSGDHALNQPDIQAISEMAKAAAVRCEIFPMGYFRDGDIVPTPVSPVDGYAYSRQETIYRPRLASSRQPAAGFTPGQFAFPALASSDLGSGDLIVVPYVLAIVGQTISGVNPASTTIGFTGSSTIVAGQVISIMYFSSSGAARQGTVQVLAIGQRESEQLPASQEVFF